MDKSLEETKKMNERSRQSKDAESKNSYANMNESALQQARQANANSAVNESSYSREGGLQQARRENMKSATNSVSTSPNSGMSSYPEMDKVKKENEKSRENKGK